MRFVGLAQITDFLLGIIILCIIIAAGGVPGTEPTGFRYYGRRFTHGWKCYCSMVQDTTAVLSAPEQASLP